MPGGKDKSLYAKTAVMAILVACFFLPVDIKSVSASLTSDLYTHFTGQFFHANVFHLLVNLYVFWLLRFSTFELIVSYLLSVPATCSSVNECVGFSSVIYVIIGIRFLFMKMDRSGRALFIITNLATAFIPGIAFGVHLSSFVLGYLFARIKRLFDEYGRACKGR